MEDGDANDVNTVYAMKIILEDESQIAKKKSVYCKKKCLVGLFQQHIIHIHVCMQEY